MSENHTYAYNYNYNNDVGNRLPIHMKMGLYIDLLKSRHANILRLLDFA